ncbi:MAG: hypothetical protein IJA81_09145 [Akkermansia sp.]|nr:hypothetical protein [Akkermansia sp.]
MEAATFKFSADTSSVMEALVSIRTSTRRAGQQMKNSMQPATGGFSACSAASGVLSKALAGLGWAAVGTAALGAGVAVKEFTQGILEAAAGVETYATRFATLMGSEQAAAAHFGQLRKYAAETPFELAGISAASTALLAFGVKAEESMGILRMLGDVAAGSGGSLEELAQIYGKVNTGGKMDTADINQISNRGLNVRAMLMERDNISSTQLRKNIEAGMYGIDDLRYVLEQATAEGGLFFGATIKQSQTLAGLWSTLADNIEELKAALGQIALADAKGLLDAGIRFVNEWRGGFAEAFSSGLAVLKDCGATAVDVCRSMEQWNPFVALFARGLEHFVLEPMREFKELAEMNAQLLEWSTTPLFKTGVEQARERELAHQTQLRADAEQRVAEYAEKAAQKAKEERDARKELQKQLATDRARRAEARDAELFGSQNAEGMRNELAYRFEQATGQKWGGGFGEDEQALLRAEDAAAKNGDRGAMSELAKLREYTELYKETQQKEIDAKNDAYEAEKKRAAALSEARRKADAAMERANLTLAGDSLGLRHLDATEAALALSQQYRGQGMSAEEADTRAAELVATQNAAQQAGLQKPELIAQSQVAVGGGGRSIRLGDAQLDVARQGVAIMTEQKRILEDLRRLMQTPVGTSGIQVVP